MIRFHVKKNQQKRVGDYTKDPDEIVWLEIAWDAFLGSDTISTVTWLIDHETSLSNADDLSIDTTQDDQTKGNLSHVNRAKVSGGFISTEYIVTNRITTSAGETKDVSVMIRCRER